MVSWVVCWRSREVVERREIWGEVVGVREVRVVCRLNIFRSRAVCVVNAS